MLCPRCRKRDVTPPPITAERLEAMRRKATSEVAHTVAELLAAWMAVWPADICLDCMRRDPSRSREWTKMTREWEEAMSRVSPAFAWIVGAERAARVHTARALDFADRMVQRFRRVQTPRRRDAERDAKTSRRQAGVRSEESDGPTLIPRT